MTILIICYVAKVVRSGITSGNIIEMTLKNLRAKQNTILEEN